jgi:hypothetical protein
MKNLFILLFTLTLLTSCVKRKFTLQVCSGSGFTYSETWLECDSFQMQSQTKAEAWIDGTKMSVIGDRGIRPESN